MPRSAIHSDIHEDRIVTDRLPREQDQRAGQDDQSLDLFLGKDLLPARKCGGTKQTLSEPSGHFNLHLANLRFDAAINRMFAQPQKVGVSSEPFEIAVTK